jgi:rod shape determining protein RodA
MNKHRRRPLWELLHLDWPLLLALLLLLGASMAILYSATGEDLDAVTRQGMRIGLSLVVMLVLAQLPPGFYARWAPPVFALGVVLLVLVLLVGDIGKGAQRWLEVGSFRFQPSEIMKLVMPMMIAAYISRYPLPPNLLHVALALGLVVFPTLLIAKQPDLGTSLLVAASGFFMIFLAGMSWRLILAAAAAMAAFLPALWFFLMHDYQKRRVLTLLNPESDPLGAGYHIIQSKIAIGSGGLWGKGWLQGTQSQLEFLPERHTDFHFRGAERGIRPGRGQPADAAVPLYHRPRPLYLGPGPGCLRPPAGRGPDPDVFCLCVRQHRHGQWPAAGGGRAPAADQLRGYLHGDTDGRIWHPHVRSYP